MNEKLLHLAAPSALALCWLVFEAGVALWLTLAIGLVWYVAFLYILCRDSYDPTTEEQSRGEQP